MTYLRVYVFTLRYHRGARLVYTNVSMSFNVYTHPFSNYGYFFLQVFDEKWNTKNDDENLFFEIYNTNK